VKASVGLDVGTTSVKAVVVAETGEILASAASGVVAMRSPHVGWAVQSTDELRSAVIDTLRSACDALPEDVQIVALAAAVQSGSVAPIARSGEIPADLTTWMDTRAAPLVEQWHSDGTAELIRGICGWTVQPGQGLPQLGWSRATSNDAWSSLGRVASADDLVTHWLTGQWVTNPSNAAGMALLDVRSGGWSQELCSLVDLTTNQLSEIRSSGTVIGRLTRETAEATGLPRDLRVINGGHDQACTALALGVSDPSQSLLAGGTAWVLTNVIPPESMADIPVEMNLSYHVAADLRTASQYLGGMGASLEWWLNSTGSSSDSGTRFAALDEELARARTDEASPYFIPSLEFSQELQVPGAGHFRNTSPDSTRADRARSIMEYAAFRIKTALHKLPEVDRPTSLTVVGGATRSPGWTQLIADICELPVTETTDASLPALGASILASVAVGLHPDNHSATEAVSVSRRSITPAVQTRDLYRRRYQIHLQQES
jgi:xylulokinase